MFTRPLVTISVYAVALALCGRFRTLTAPGDPRDTVPAPQHEHMDASMTMDTAAWRE